MPREADSLGIRFAGPVLTGRMSVEMTRAVDARKVDKDEEYAQPADYDQVLRAHCRLTPGPDQGGEPTTPDDGQLNRSAPRYARN